VKRVPGLQLLHRVVVDRPFVLAFEDIAEYGPGWRCGGLDWPASSMTSTVVTLLSLPPIFSTMSFSEITIAGPLWGPSGSISVEPAMPSRTQTASVRIVRIVASRYSGFLPGW